METTTIIILVGIWLLLGLRSCYFLVKRFTLHRDFTSSDIHMFILCLFFPIITHIATYIVYHKHGDDNEDENILFKRKSN